MKLYVKLNVLEESALYNSVKGVATIDMLGSTGFRANVITRLC